MATDKKISDLPTAGSVSAADVSILVHDDVNYQFNFSSLLEFINSGVITGSNIFFGTVLPQNTNGKNGDVFFNTASGTFAQKTAGTWIIKYTLPINGTQATNAVIYGGGIPGAGTGNNGDTYININSGIFYQKSGTGWAQVFSMQTGPQGPKGDKGDSGIAGTAGKSILSGTLNPSNLTVGTDGDFYLNTNTYTLFGPKAAGTWPLGVSLIGDGGIAGPKGDTGPAGAVGQAGPQGATGTAGATGPAGPQGPAGPKGDTGDMGPAGPAGATGPQGPAGEGGSGDGLGIKVYNVESYGAVHDGITDDTVAIQAALNAAHTAGGGVVYLPNGIYLIAAALNAYGCQLYVPFDDLTTSETNSHVKLLGEIGPNFYSDPVPIGFGSSYLPSDKGVILQSTLNGAGDVIGSQAGTLDFNFCHLEIENITIRVRSKNNSGVPIGPAATALNAFKLSYLELYNVKIETQTKQTETVQPLPTARGIVFPATNNFVFVHADKVLVNGYYTGCEIYECATLNNIFIDGCMEGISFNNSNHPAFVSNIFISRTKIKVVVKGVMNFFIDRLGIEEEFGQPFWWGGLNNYDLDERVLGSRATIKFNIFTNELGNDGFLRSNNSPLSKIKAISVGEDIVIPTVSNNEKLVSQRKDGTRTTYQVARVYLNNIDDTGGLKTIGQLNAAYPDAILGQRVRGAAGYYEKYPLGWFYVQYQKV